MAGADRRYRFEGYRVDTQARELLAPDGSAVPLTGKAFDTLVLLVGQRDRVVPKDELLSTVWAGRVVEENNLTQAISALRRALGTGAGEHRYIVTVPGRGYRFVAAVEVEPDVEEKPSGAPPGSGTRKDRRRPQRVLAGAAVLLAAALAAGWWSTRAPPRSPPAATAPAPALPPANADAPLTLAVLPFRSLPEESRDELLELGLADTLITRIAGGSALRVTPLSSSQHFAGPAQDPVEAAHALGVAYIVEGTTQRHGNGVKVNVRLRAADGTPMWSDSFEEGIGRIFTLQDRIADHVATALAVTVAAPVHTSPCDGADAEAYRAYLSGQYRIARPSAANARKAIADFRRAIDLDPTCARAHAAMANAYRTLVPTADAEPGDTFARVQALAGHALALDPQLAEAHVMQGWIHFWHDWDWGASEAAFRRAIELNPSLADAHLGYAHLLGNLGRGDEARVHGRRAIALDPMSPVINTLAGRSRVPPGQEVRALDRALELDPDYWLALLMRGGMRQREGDATGGLADMERARQLCGGCSHALASIGRAQARLGRPEIARQLLRELEARDRDAYVPASSLASLHNALGETDAALDLLERAFRERDYRMTFLGIDAGWANLRTHPRFRTLMQRMRLREPSPRDVRTSTPPSPTPPEADRSSR